MKTVDRASQFPGSSQFPGARRQFDPFLFFFHRFDCRWWSFERCVKWRRAADAFLEAEVAHATTGKPWLGYAYRPHPTALLMDWAIARAGFGVLPEARRDEDSAAGRPPTEAGGRRLLVPTVDWLDDDDPGFELGSAKRSRPVLPSEQTFSGKGFAVSYSGAGGVLLSREIETLVGRLEEVLAASANGARDITLVAGPPLRFDARLAWAWSLRTGCATLVCDRNEVGSAVRWASPTLLFLSVSEMAGLETLVAAMPKRARRRFLKKLRAVVCVGEEDELSQLNIGNGRFEIVPIAVAETPLGISARVGWLPFSTATGSADETMGERDTNRPPDERETSE